MIKLSVEGQEAIVESLKLKVREAANSFMSAVKNLDYEMYVSEPEEWEDEDYAHFNVAVASSPESPPEETITVDFRLVDAVTWQGDERLAGMANVHFTASTMDAIKIAGYEPYNQTPMVWVPLDSEELMGRIDAFDSYEFAEEVLEEIGKRAVGGLSEEGEMPEDMDVGVRPQGLTIVDYGEGV